MALETPDYRLNRPGKIDGVIEVDTRTGKTLWMAPHGDDMYLHPSKPIIVVEDRCQNLVRILNEDRQQVGKTAMENFALLDVAFASDIIALAEGAKGIRTIDSAGNVLTRHSPSDRTPNCIRIAFDGDLVCTFDSWDGAFVTILNSVNGRVVNEYKRPTGGEICFIDHGSRFVDRHGNVCLTSDGKAVASIPPRPKR